MARNERLALILGMVLLIGGLAGIGLGNAPSEASAHEGTDSQSTENTQEDDGEHQRSPAHERMHEMMDNMMGEGFTERMHAAMPGSEQMMEACANRMGGMMDNMDEMMPHDGMMNGDNMMNQMGKP